jgi:diadenosine tetraphosphatase ApaH/serine/threonine PP2A family protein phosphatase
VRVAIVSDIHGNLHALEAVLEAIDRDAPDAIWCLGDLVGYGPRPNRCCAIVAERADFCLIGNHDLAVLGRLDLDEFQPDAAVAARWTTAALEDEPRAYLESLGASGEREGVGLFHASPRDPIWEYVLSSEVADASMAAASQELVLVGHSHVALYYRVSDGTLLPAGEDTQLELSDDRWLLNPGSVGQPRDTDPRAAWLLLDLEGRHASFHRVEYDVAKTQQEIRDRGLPEALAARLEFGV